MLTIRAIAYARQCEACLNRTFEICFGIWKVYWPHHIYGPTQEFGNMKMSIEKHMTCGDIMVNEPTIYQYVFD